MEKLALTNRYILIPSLTVKKSKNLTLGINTSFVRFY